MSQRTGRWGACTKKLLVPPCLSELSDVGGGRGDQDTRSTGRGGSMATPNHHWYGAGSQVSPGSLSPSVCSFQLRDGFRVALPGIGFTVPLIPWDGEPLRGGQPPLLRAPSPHGPTPLLAPPIPPASPHLAAYPNSSLVYSIPLGDGEGKVERVLFRGLFLPGDM